MNKLPLFFALLALISCTPKDPFSNLSGFWVSVEYQQGRPFQTLTIRGPFLDSNYSSHPMCFIETNQYGAYPYVYPLDTVHGQLTAFGPEWYVDFTIRLEGDTLLQDFPSRDPDDDKTMKYIRMDSIKGWRDAILSDVLLHIDLPAATWYDSLILKKRSLVADLFLGPKKEEQRAIARDSIFLQVGDVLISSHELGGFLRSELAKQDEEDRDSIIVVLNADRNIPEVEIREWVTRVQRFNPSLRVWRRYIDLERHKFHYRSLIANSKGD